MTLPDVGGFFMFRWGEGAFLITAFWTFILGLAFIAPAVLLFMNKRLGANLALGLGIAAATIALADIILIYATMQTENYPTNHAGAGLWVCLVFAAGAIVAAGLKIYYADFTG